MLSECPSVSIIIKAFNEQRHIAASIESALRALAGMNGEIILADSASTDQTVEIAATYPVKIVTLRSAADRSCGAGVQLGYQYSVGDYVCLLDGDMQLHTDFLPAAIKFLEQNPEFAGVGGMIVERETGNCEYVKRAQAVDFDRLPGEVKKLDCGGVYRRQAIETVGYLGDRNLHGGEEFELAVRLRARGWRLSRIAVTAIDHNGHAGNPYALLRRRWLTGFAFSTGEILRATFGRESFPLTLRKLRWELFLFAAVHLWWLALIGATFFADGLSMAVAATLLAVLPFAAMSVRSRSVAIGVYSVTAWNVYSAGLWPGLLRRRTNPAHWIESKVIRDVESADTRTAA
jgi:glycosyltransferase involved in cell wall biosynthesis